MGGEKCLACTVIVCAQYVTAAPFICEVICYTSDVFLHNIHVVVVTSVQSTYNYVPESNRVAGVYNVATVLQLLLLAHVMLLPMINIVHFYFSLSSSSPLLLFYC